MSDEERAIKKLELKNILMSVPIKAIISGIITYAVSSSQGTSIGMSIFMFVLAGCFLLSALSQVLHVNSLIWIGQALFVVALHLQYQDNL